MKKTGLVFAAVLMTVALLFWETAYAQISVRPMEDALRASFETRMRTDQATIHTAADVLDQFAKTFGYTERPDIGNVSYVFEADVRAGDAQTTVHVISFIRHADAARAAAYAANAVYEFESLQENGDGIRMAERTHTHMGDVYVRMVEYVKQGSVVQTAVFHRDSYTVVLTYPKRDAGVMYRMIPSFYEQLETVRLADAERTAQTYLTVDFTPSCFSDTSDVVTLTATLHNLDSYTGQNPLDRIFLYHTDTFERIESKPLVEGKASFTVLKEEREPGAHRYTVVVGDFQHNVEIPTLRTGLTIESSVLADAPYEGLVIGHNESLRIQLVLSGATGGTLRIRPPRLGRIRTDRLFDTRIIRNPDETIRLQYVPPAYAQGPWQRKLLYGEWVYYQTVELVFEYTPHRGEPILLETNIDLYRKPVVFIAFNRREYDEMRPLAAHLQEQDRTVLWSLGTGDYETFEQAADALDQTIRDLMRRWNEARIKISNVDAIGYGLGGLTMRTYMQTPHRYTNHIRKALFVATPHKGFDSEFLQLQSHLLGQKTEQIIASVRNNSAFLHRLNEDVEYARHLLARSQYANLVGYSGHSAHLEGDGVVPLIYASLEGVQTHVFWNMVHSKEISNTFTPLLTSDQVKDTVLVLLDEDIKPAQMDHMHAVIVRMEGDIYIMRRGPDGQYVKTPLRESERTDYYPLQPSETLIVENGRAVVSIFVNGLKVSELFIDEYSGFQVGAYAHEIVYGTMTHGRVLVSSSSRKVRQVVFFDTVAGIYKASIQNSILLIDRLDEAQPSVEAYAGTPTVALHRHDVAQAPTGVEVNRRYSLIQNTFSDVTEPAFFDHPFYQNTLARRLANVSHAVTYRVASLVSAVSQTGSINYLFRYNRRLLTPVVVLILLIALFFVGLSQRKVRLGVFLILCMITLIIVLPRVL